MGFQLTGIVILLIFFGCYLMKMVQQRKRGIQTDQIGKGKTGVVKIIELTMKASTYLVLAAAVFSILMDTHLFPMSARVVGALIGMAGTAVFIISVVTMQDSWRAGVSTSDQTEFVTSGIYRHSRNPAFLGFDLLYLGVAVMFFNWVLLAASLFAAVMLHLQIVHVEEDFLADTFGAEYLEYRNTVGRYWGRRRS